MQDAKAAYGRGTHQNWKVKSQAKPPDRGDP